MIKIFVQRDHHELENQMNDWFSSNRISFYNISYSAFSMDEDVIHSVIIYYELKDSNPC